MPSQLVRAVGSGWLLAALLLVAPLPAAAQIPFEFAKDFENVPACFPTSYSDPDKANCDDWDAVEGNVQVSSVRAHSGTTSVRVTYAGNEQSGLLLKRLPVGYDTIYISAWLYFEPGFYFPADNKTIYVFKINSFQTMFSVLNFDNNPLTEGDAWEVYENGANPIDWDFYSGATITAGRWYHIELEVRLNTRLAPADGIIRLWVDNTLLIDRNNVAVRDRLADQIEYFGFGINYSNGCCGGWKAPGPVHKYFDDIYVAAGYTGSTPRVGEPPTTTPSAPSGLTLQ